MDELTVIRDISITLWNDDKMTIPFIQGRYRFKTVMKHVRLLLKMEEQRHRNKGVN
jgi:hypothetical protein